MRAGIDQASMHIRTVSSEPSLIALERRNIDEGSGQIIYTSYVIMVLFAYSSSEWSGRRACTFAQSHQSLWKSHSKEGM